MVADCPPGSIPRLKAAIPFFLSVWFFELSFALLRGPIKHASFHVPTGASLTQPHSNTISRLQHMQHMPYALCMNIMYMCACARGVLEFFAFWCPVAERTHFLHFHSLCNAPCGRRCAFDTPFNAHCGARPVGLGHCCGGHVL